MDGFLEDALHNFQTGIRECEYDFAEAIIAREYNIAHALLTRGLQLELPEIMLRAKIEDCCQLKASTHGYDGFHHPIDFVILHHVSPEAFNPKSQKPVRFEADPKFLRLVTSKFYPRSNLEFEVFFELCLVLVTVGETVRIAHFEIW